MNLENQRKAVTTTLEEVVKLEKINIMWYNLWYRRESLAIHSLEWHIENRINV